jgi:hypothetical protein
MWVAQAEYSCIIHDRLHTRYTTETYFRMLIDSGTAREYVTADIWTAVPLMHKLVYPVCPEINWLPAHSCSM